MKYMGSKARLAKDISPIINKLIKDNGIKIYVEPFVGGANMIEHIVCNQKIGSDNNRYLISMWNAFKDGWTPPEDIPKEMYSYIRDNKNICDERLVAVAGFCATYNAKWFGGYAGKVNTKIGTVRNYYEESVRNILKQIPKLKDVEFINEDYNYFSDHIDTLIYCDPPYANTTKYKDDFDHLAFWNWVTNVSKNNIVLVSEYNAPDDFVKIYEKKLTTTLDKNSRKTDTEKLFVHKSLLNRI
jgi:DNA adenine methylase